MKIYIDADFKCYTSPGEWLTAIETDAFDGKCRQYIEGCRFIPNGGIWVRDDGEVFEGEMVAPWRDYEILAEFQAIYEEEQTKATEEIATIVEEVYNSDIGVIENV